MTGALLLACRPLVLLSPEAFSCPLVPSWSGLQSGGPGSAPPPPPRASGARLRAGLTAGWGDPPTEGALELHTHHLIPSLRQVVFQGDRLPFQCSASYLGEDTRIRWYHNRAPLEGDEQAGILLAESLIHDCTFVTRYRPCRRSAPSPPPLISPNRLAREVLLSP